MTHRSTLVLAGALTSLLMSCSDETPQAPAEAPAAVAPSLAPAAHPAAANEGEAPAMESPAAEAPAMVPGTLRVVVLRPETLLASEERIMSAFFDRLEATDMQVLAADASPVERSSLATLFGDGEWTRPAAWAQHDVVLVLAFSQPAMVGGREPQAYTRGVRCAALWTAGEEQPAFVHESRLAHGGGGNLERLDTPPELMESLVLLALEARSRS